MATFTFHNTATTIQIANDLVVSMTMDDPIFKIFPIRRRNTMNLRWEIKDNYAGLMKLRGLGGEPTSIPRIGANLYETRPGVYGEFGTVDEEELTARAKNVENLDVRVDVSDLIGDIQTHLLTRQINRVRALLWTLALTGSYSVALPQGGIGHTDSYSITTATVSPLWSSTTTATPLKNLRDLQPTYGRGNSTNFGTGATLWMNSLTANYLLSNTNAADLGGKREAAGSTVDDLPGINKILLGQGAPQIMVYDEGYLNDSGTFTLFIPDGKVLVVGQRPAGETPGEFMMVYNAVSKGAGEYAVVIDKTDGPAREIPPKIEVHAGFNGGPAMTRPSQILVLTVA